MLLYLPAESPPLKPSGPSRHIRRSTFSWCLGDEFSSLSLRFLQRFEKAIRHMSFSGQCFSSSKSRMKRRLWR